MAKPKKSKKRRKLDKKVECTRKMIAARRPKAWWFWVLDMSAGASDPPEAEYLSVEMIKDRYRGHAEDVFIFSGALVKDIGEAGLEKLSEFVDLERRSVGS